MEAAREPVQDHQLFEERRAFRLQGVRLDRTPHREPHVLGLPGLRNVAIDVAVVDGVTERLGVAVGRHQDADRAAVELTHLAQKLRALDLGHLVVGEHDRDGMLSEQRQALARARRREHGEVTAEGQLEDAQVVGFVVHVEHGVLTVVEQT